MNIPLLMCLHTEETEDGVLPVCGAPATNYSCHNGPRAQVYNACADHKCRCAQPAERATLPQSAKVEPVVWADEASPFTGAQVKALLEENEKLRRRVKHLEDDSFCEEHGVQGCIECEERCEDCGDETLKMEVRDGRRLCENCIWEEDKCEFCNTKHTYKTEDDVKLCGSAKCKNAYLEDRKP